jgi:epidermal growth factor receptor substrate 15
MVVTNKLEKEKKEIEVNRDELLNQLSLEHQDNLIKMEKSINEKCLIKLNQYGTELNKKTDVKIKEADEKVVELTNQIKIIQENYKDEKKKIITLLENKELEREHEREQSCEREKKLKKLSEELLRKNSEISIELEKNKKESDELDKRLIAEKKNFQEFVSKEQENLKNERAKLNKEKEDMMASFAEMKEEMRLKTKSLEGIVSSKDEYISSIQRISTENLDKLQSYQESLFSLKEELNNVQAELKKNSKENDKLMRIKERYESELDKKTELEKNFEIERQNRKQIEHENLNIKENLLLSKEELEKERCESSRLREIFSKLSNEKSEFEELMIAYSEKNKELFDDGVALKKALGYYQGEYEGLQAYKKDKEKLDEELQKKSKDARKLEETCLELTTKLTRLELDMKNKDKTIETMNENFSKKLSSKKDRISELEKMLSQSLSQSLASK